MICTAVICLRLGAVPNSQLADGTRGGYFCSKCRAEVTASPTTQVALLVSAIPLICTVCWKRQAKPGDEIGLVPGAVQEIRRGLLRRVASACRN